MSEGPKIWRGSYKDCPCCEGVNLDMDFSTKRITCLHCLLSAPRETWNKRPASKSTESYRQVTLFLCLIGSFVVGWALRMTQ